MKHSPWADAKTAICLSTWEETPGLSLHDAVASLLDTERDAEREAIAALVKGWHIKKGGYTELARIIRNPGGGS